MSKLTLEQALERLEDEFKNSVPVCDIVNFIKKSQRGIARPRWAI